jgi:hypothetical protein
MPRVLTLVGLAAGAPAATQPMLVPTKSPFVEQSTERVPVSGHTLVGLVSTVTGQPPSRLSGATPPLPAATPAAPALAAAAAPPMAAAGE